MVLVADFNIYCLQDNVCFGQPLHRQSDQKGRSGVNHPENEAELDSFGWNSSPQSQALCLRREGQAMFVFWIKQTATFCTELEKSLKYFFFV